PWFGHVHRCDRALFVSARLNVEFDSSASWESVRCPVLAIYGDRDTSSGAPEPLIALIRRGLEKAGDRDVTVRIFADADHSLRRARKVGREGDGNSDFVPGYLDAMTDWLAARLGPLR